MLFGTAIFWLIGLFAKKEKIAHKDLIIVVIGGLVGMLATQFSFALSMEYTTPVTFSLITALCPVFVMVFALILLSEPITIKKFIGVVLGIGGAIAIIIPDLQHTGGGTNAILGILFSVIAVLCNAIYLIIVRKVSDKYTPLTLMKWMFLTSFIVILPFGLPEIHTQAIYSSAVTINAVLELGFVLALATALAFFLMPVGEKRVKATVAAIYGNLQPIVATVVAIIVGQDMFNWYIPVATILIIGGVYVVTTHQKISS
jgi:drug/metabolite transporter (DMT)-like permease